MRIAECDIWDCVLLNSVQPRGFNECCIKDCDETGQADIFVSWNIIPLKRVFAIKCLPLPADFYQVRRLFLLFCLCLLF